MENAHLLSTPMIVRSFDPKKDPFYPNEDDKEILALEVLYLNVISSLLYLAQCTNQDIAFSVNLFVKFSSVRHEDVRLTSNIHSDIFVE